MGSCMDQFVAVFTEAFLAQLLPVFAEVALPSIRLLQPGMYIQAATVACAGALLAAWLLYALGIWLRRMPERVSTEAQLARIEGMRGAARHWLPYLLILAPTPVGGVLIVAAGFFRIHPLVAGLAVLGGQVLWRVSPLLH